MFDGKLLAVLALLLQLTAEERGNETKHIKLHTTTERNKTEQN